MARNSRPNNRTNDRRRRHRILALIAAGAVAVVVALVVAIIVIMVRRPEPSTTAIPPTALPPTSAPVKKPRPAFQDASCPDVEMIAIPGTWESSPTDDPLQTRPIPHRPVARRDAPDPGAVRPGPGRGLHGYTAQFHNPLSADKQMSYNDSRAEGTGVAVRAMTEMNNRCPLTSYVLVGFPRAR